MIRLDYIDIQNFRGIREGRVEELADVNVLVGRNNSGKSTVMEAVMTLARGTGHWQQDCLGRNFESQWQTPRNESGTWPIGLFYRFDRNHEIRLSGRLLNSERSESPGRPFVTVIEGGPPPRSRQEGEIWGGSVDSQDAVQFLRRMTLIRPLDARNREVELKFWPELLARRGDKPLTKELNDVFGLNVESLQLLPDGRLMLVLESYSLPLDAQGDATRGVLRTLITLSVLNGTMLFLEEPECHQHPGSLERLALSVCRHARQRKLQLVISTHSAECVRAFLKAGDTARSEMAVFHFRLEDGKLDVRKLDAEAATSLDAMGVDPRFLDLYG
jgi:hypothetical protein